MRFDLGVVLGDHRGLRLPFGVGVLIPERVDLGTGLVGQVSVAAQSDRRVRIALPRSTNLSRLSCLNNSIAITPRDVQQPISPMPSAQVGLGARWRSC